VVFALLFVVCGYLLIYNVFDISVMQDVRQYGLLRTIGTSSRQIKKLVNQQALCLTLISLPIGLATGFLAGWLVLPVAMSLFSSEHKSVMSALQVSTSPLIFVIASMFTILTVYISTRKAGQMENKATFPAPAFQLFQIYLSSNFAACLVPSGSGRFSTS